MNYENAMQQLNDGQYESAFKAFQSIANNDTLTKQQRADSLNMMGAIISGFAPYLDDEENGLKYYKKAIEFDPDNIGALLNIADGYGESPSMHQDKKLFVRAANKLINELSDKIEENELSRLKEKLNHFRVSNKPE